MGIRGLTGWIHWRASTAQTVPDWSTFRGKTIGIDILGFLYKAKAQHKSIFHYLTHLIISFKKYDITPLPIFDGKPPDEKKAALKARSALRASSDIRKKALEDDLTSLPLSDMQKDILTRELRGLELNTSYLTSEERDQAKQFFYACGILPLNATGEADNTLAYFAKRGTLAAVMSNDLDLLTRGVEVLLVPETYAMIGDSSGWIQYNLSSILETAELSYQQFVEMCVLMGCDYTVGHPSLPYKSAYWAIKYRGEIQATLRVLNVADPEHYKRAILIYKGDLDDEETLMGEKQWEKLAAGSPLPERDALTEFRSSALASIPATLYTELMTLVLLAVPEHGQ